MAFDQNALDSLRIERNSAPTGGGPKPLYKWAVIGALVLAVAIGLYALLHKKAIEVETATAVQSSRPVTVQGWRTSLRPGRRNDLS